MDFVTTCTQEQTFAAERPLQALARTVLSFFVGRHRYDIMDMSEWLHSLNSGQDPAPQVQCLERPVHSRHSHELHMYIRKHTDHILYTVQRGRAAGILAPSFPMSLSGGMHVHIQYLDNAVTTVVTTLTALLTMPKQGMNYLRKVIAK